MIGASLSSSVASVEDSRRQCQRECHDPILALSVSNNPPHCSIRLRGSNFVHRRFGDAASGVPLAVKHLIKQNYDLVAGPSNMRPRRAQCRGEKLPAYNAPSDDWGLVHARSRLDPIFGLCVCEVRTPGPLGARHTWGRDVRELIQAVFPWFSLAPRVPERPIVIDSLTVAVPLASWNRCCVS